MNVCRALGAGAAARRVAGSTLKRPLNGPCRVTFSLVDRESLSLVRVQRRAFSEKKGKAVPIGLLKNQPDPEILSNSEYPPWLFEVVDELKEGERVPNLNEETTWAQGGKKYFKKHNTKNIKHANDAPSEY